MNTKPEPLNSAKLLAIDQDDANEMLGGNGETCTYHLTNHQETMEDVIKTDLIEEDTALSLP